MLEVLSLSIKQLYYEQLNSITWQYKNQTFREALPKGFSERYRN